MKILGSEGKEEAAGAADPALVQGVLCPFKSTQFAGVDNFGRQGVKCIESNCRTDCALYVPLTKDCAFKVIAHKLTVLAGAGAPRG